MALLRLAMILMLVCMVYVAAADDKYKRCMEKGECNGVKLDPVRQGIMRRALASQGRHISYDALRLNTVPCTRKGQSYYNCHEMEEVNPYVRGCSVITNCARDLN